MNKRITECFIIAWWEYNQGNKKNAEHYLWNAMWKFGYNATYQGEAFKLKIELPDPK